MRNSAGGFAGTVGRVVSIGGRTIQVLGKARRILDCFSPEQPELTFGQLRRATGLPPSTCLRLLNSLLEFGFLEREGDRWRPGIRLLTWAAAAAEGMDIGRRAGPVLRRLRDATGETAAVWVQRGGVRVSLAIEETHHPVRRLLSVGQVLPLHAGSGGKVLLAYDEALAQRVLSGPLQRYTERTLVDREAWEAELALIRRRGYAVSFEERDREAASISAPVFDAGGRIAGAVGIAGPSQRFQPDRMEAWVRSVLEAAAELSRQLGYRAAAGSEQPAPAAGGGTP
nr:IclR family transcriptional regulator [Bacillota bacterium]